MKKTLLVIGLALGLASTANAGVIAVQSAEGVLSNTASGFTTIDFETGDCSGYVSCIGNYAVRDSEGGSAAPFMATPVGEHWLSVPDPLSNGSADFGLGADYNYFGMFWGSIDNYNDISFYDDGALVATFNGADLTPLLADGGQGDWDSNRFINFGFTGTDVYDTVRLSSGGRAFETDNHSYGNWGGTTTFVAEVPEPTGIALFGLAAIGLAASRRKQIKAKI
jgi:hypothetical protein